MMPLTERNCIAQQLVWASPRLSEKGPLTLGIGRYGFRSALVATQNMARQYRLSVTLRLYAIET